MGTSHCESDGAKRRRDNAPGDVRRPYEGRYDDLVKVVLTYGAFCRTAQICLHIAAAWWARTPQLTVLYWWTIVTSRISSSCYRTTILPMFVLADGGAITT